MSFRNTVFKSILNGIYFSGSHLLFQRWTGGLGSILMFHHVRNAEPREFSPNAHLTVSPEFLETTIKSLRAKKVDIVSMDEAVDRIRTGQMGHKGRPFVVITFDDGYRDNAEIAAPILRKYNAPYTIFVATGLIDGTADLWWDGLEAIVEKHDHLLVRTDASVEEIDCSTVDAKRQSYAILLEYLTNDLSEERQRQWVRELATLYKVDLKALLESEMMSWSEIEEISKDPLCTIGAHTIHHYALARLDGETAEFEMRQGARILESVLGRMPRHFAYPYGYSAAAGIRDFELAASQGFVSAVTTRPGVIYNQHRSYMNALPRVSMNGHFQKNRYTKALLSGLPTLLTNKMRRLNVE